MTSLLFATHRERASCLTVRFHRKSSVLPPTCSRERGRVFRPRRFLENVGFLGREKSARSTSTGRSVGGLKSLMWNYEIFRPSGQRLDRVGVNFPRLSDRTRPPLLCTGSAARNFLVKQRFLLLFVPRNGALHPSCGRVFVCLFSILRRTSRINLVSASFFFARDLFCLAFRDLCE